MVPPRSKTTLWLFIVHIFPTSSVYMFYVFVIGGLRLILDLCFLFRVGVIVDRHRRV